jgi:uncharacterized membrane protein
MTERIKEWTRWQSKWLWSAIIAQVIVILKLVGVDIYFGVDFGVIEMIFEALLQLFVIVGIINNATSKENW